MTKTRKIAVISILSALLIALIVLIAIALHPKSASDKDLPIIRSDGEFVINVNDPHAVVGYSDYVFVGYVNSKDDVEYLVPDNNNGLPQTNYTITVIENIKGSLSQDTPIHLQKDGGVTRDGSHISLFEGDYLPEEGMLYLFAADTGDDGRLYCSAPNSSIPLSETAEPISSAAFSVENAQKVAAESEIVSIYREALKSEIVYDRDRYVSIYDSAEK